ncbi:hypothetical protein ACFQZO_04735 [Bradyrhizobium sp. GCM10027634]|uniref:hypothetical protein n=1 Tax=unclassified Bradyrhizobium TaxID=2631580 RepID=UPI00188AE9AB|nr:MULTISPECIES: hypothetical protein [unclassified Bradyrhizobium]MDN5000188.1 hypothetical protein [Bradyrhizobium sp. WYCCWR 12677]
MRSHVVAILAVLPLISTPAAAQQQTGATPQAGVNQNLQTEADKGIKTRNSGESGYVANQDKPGAASHAPGESNTVGAARESTPSNGSSNLNSSQADYNASLNDGSAPKK